MTVELSSETQAILEQGIAAGRFASASEAVEKAVRLLTKAEPKRVRSLVEVMQASPHKEIDLIQPWPEFAPTRDVEF